MKSGFLALILNLDNTPPYFSTIHTGAVAVSKGGAGKLFSGGAAAQR